MNINARKRRPYYHEDHLGEPEFHHIHHQAPPPPPPIPPLGPAGYDYTSSLPSKVQYFLGQDELHTIKIEVPLACVVDIDRPDNQRLIQERAALSIGEPWPLFQEISNRRHQARKRPRLNTDITTFSTLGPNPGDLEGDVEPVATPFSSAMASSALPDGVGVGDGRRSFPVGQYTHTGFPSVWGTSQIAECLPCFPSEEPPLGYDIVGRRPPAVAGPLPPETHVPNHGGLIPTTPMTESKHFACDDDPALLSMWPPLQPAQVTGIQPNTSREGMVYPVSSSGGGPLAQTAGLGISASQQIISPMDGPSATSTTFATPTMGSPSYTRQVGFLASYQADYHGYPGEAEHPEMQGGLVNNNNMMVEPPRVPPSRRGPFRTDCLREKTAHTRKIGSCIRCRMQRIRCDLDEEDQRGPCLQCKKMANSKGPPPPCLRWKIPDTKLFKPGMVKGHEWTTRWKESVVDDIETWASSEIKTIGVTEGYTGRAVQLRVRRFVPQEGDKLERTWVSGGVQKSVPIPPFAIVNKDEAKAAIDEYITGGLRACCRKLLRSEMLWKTYFYAMQLTAAPSTPEAERALLHNTLKLWMSVRMTTKSFEIVGEETLGMSRNLINDKSNPSHGKIPIPPVMGAQLDSLLIFEVQGPLRRKVLEELQKMTLDKKLKNWLPTYLVTFILLHNLALITKHDADYARKHGMKTRFAREEKVKEYNQGANTLLAYFHYCNKGVLPFSEDCKDADLHSLGEMDDYAVQLVRETRQLIKKHKREWQELWDNDDYENEWYYCSQLFQENWQPRLMA